MAQDNHYEHQKRTLYDPTGNVLWASDTVSGVQYPRIKVVWGADGSAADASASNPLPITDAALAAAIQTDNTAISTKGIGLIGSASGTAHLVPLDTGANNAIEVSGGVAHDATDSGNPINLGARASTALSGLTLVANADRTYLYAGVDGVLVVRPHCNLEDIVSGNATNTDGASTECIAAQATGIKTYLMAVTLANSSASAITVDIKDGTTVKWTFPVPATGGVTHSFPIPIPGTAATAWNFDGSAAATTLTCSMIGFKSKV